jgi:Na+/phosphate symporter
MFYGGLAVILIISALAIFLIVRTNVLHAKKEKKQAKKEAAVIIEARETLVNTLTEDIKAFLTSLNKCFKNVYVGLIEEDRKKLKKALNESAELEETSSVIIGKMMQGTQFLDELELQEELGFGKALSSFQDTSASMRDIVKISFEHIDNNHSGLTKDQKEDFKQLKDLLAEQIELASSKINKKDVAKLDDIQEKMKDFKKSIKKLDRNQIAYIKKGTSKPRTNLLLLNILFKVEKISNDVAEIINFNRQLLKGKK